jgi:hypothetical protein
LKKEERRPQDRDELVDEFFDKRHAVQAIAFGASELVD